MRFTKMEATGNDFVVIDNDSEDYSWPELARKLCDRHYGVGADGILVVLPSLVANAKMRIFNSDGSEAETCGNGLRCFAKYILTNKSLNVNDDKYLTVETKAGIKRVTPEGDKEEIPLLKVNMGKPAFSPGKIPVRIKVTKTGIRSTPPVMDYPVTLGRSKIFLTFVSMGNPHAVCFLKKPVEDYPLNQIGPRIENLEMFPEKTNFEIVNIINPNKIKVRVWERGAGATLSCGTGACAAAVASILHGFTDTTIDVELSGGILKIEWNGKDEVTLCGPANFVFQGEWKERANL